MLWIPGRAPSSWIHCGRQNDHNESSFELARLALTRLSETGLDVDLDVVVGGLDPGNPGRRYHAVVVDIDHSPRHVLHPSHAPFYQPDGLRVLAEHLHPRGVFGLWSNDSPDDEFTAALEQAFTDVQAEVITFDNPLQQRTATATVYLATAHAAGGGTTANRHRD